MSLDILVHKNGYTKTHISFMHSAINNIEKHHVVNVHDRLYDLFYLFKPKKILLQFEEYTNEWHSFINDASISNKPQIFVTIDNNPSKKEEYIKLLNQIKDSNCVFIAPKSLVKEVPKAKYIEYEHLYNDEIYFPLNEPRNDKTLCILSTDPKCIEEIEEYLYPRNKKEKICLINNKEIDHHQNIGLMFDNDMNIGLNLFSSVIDLSGSYGAEITACNIPISDKDRNKYPSKEEIVTTNTFMKQHIL